MDFVEIKIMLILLLGIMLVLLLQTADEESLGYALKSVYDYEYH